MEENTLDYLKKLIKTILFTIGMMLVLFFFLILILQTRYGYLHASENCDSTELSFKEHLACISKTNIPFMNAYSQCRLVGIHRDYNGEKYVRFCVYRCQDSSLEYLKEPDHRGGCEVNRILIKTAI